MQSIIASLDESEIQDDPFPHIVRRNALDPVLFRDLVAEFPKLHQFPDNTEGSNKRLTFKISDARHSEFVTPLWRDFLDTHVSREHFLSMAGLFGGRISKMFANGNKFIANAPAMRTATKGCGNDAGAQVLLAASIDANTPVTSEASSVRGPHVDHPTKLIVALLYLRDEDDSEGGDLLLYRLKQGRNLKDSVLPGCHFRDDSVEYVKTVRYEPNTLFVWLNSPTSIHGVSPRHSTERPRKFCNFYCGLARPAF